MKPLFYPPPPPPPVPKGKISGQVLNWNNKTQTWQITGDGPLAFGNYAGQENQGTAGISIGIQAGRTNQSTGSIAIGLQSGSLNQASQSIAIGYQSASNTQGANSIAIGYQAGENSQNQQSIAIGYQAGQFNQGENSIAIGKLAGPTGQGQNSIVLNASGSGVTGGTSGFFVSPIRNTMQSTALGYDTTTNEITYYNTSGNIGSFTNLTSSNDTYLATTTNTKVGIGTTDPNATLDVSGNTIISGTLDVTNTITGLTGSFTNLNSSNDTYLATTAGTKLGVGKTSASATATLDVSGNAEISGTLAVGGTIIRGSNATNGTSGFFINPIRNITQTTSLGYDTTTNEITYFNAQYASDSWLLMNLLGQPPAITFNPPKSQSDKIFISWNYPSQKIIGFLNNNSPVPFLETFSLYVNTDANNNYVVKDKSDQDFIKSSSESTPVTMIVLYKNSITTNPNVQTNTEYTLDDGRKYSGKAYHVYNETIANQINGNNNQNILYAWYKNDSTFNNIYISSLNFLKFTGSGKPTEPRDVKVTTQNVTSTSLLISYLAALVPDQNNANEGSITSYRVKYSSVGSHIRYPNGISHGEQTTSQNAGPNDPINTTYYTTLSNLYPDSSYNIQVAAINNSDIIGDYTTPPTTGITTNLTPLDPITSASITFTYTSYSNNPSSIYIVGSTVNPIGTTPLVKSDISCNNVIMPIHRISNRGRLQTSGTLMTFSANVNSSTTYDASINFQGFPATAPSNVNNSVISITNASVVDNFTSPTQNQGFYLNAKINMTIKNTAFIVRNTAVNTINFSQSFATLPVTSSSGSFSFYYDTPITTAPTVSLSSFGIASSFFKQISGIYVLHSTTRITMQPIASNMGNYFYRRPLLTYTCSVNSTTSTFDETDLRNVNSSYYSGNKLASSIVFDSSMNTPNISSNTYTTQMTLSVVANNIHTSSGSVSTTQNVIIDGPSNTLVYSTLSQGIPTLGTNTPGYRVWSAPSISNNCPDLSFNGTTYRDISYNNTWDITKTYGLYNATTELLVSNGLFRSRGSTGYNDYSNSLYNTGINYSAIPSSGFRFATFCWKLAGKNPGFYSNLSFTINSITPTPSTNNSGLLTINNRQIQVLYFFQDESQLSTFSGSVLNSVWIDGNKNTNVVNKNTFFETTNKYGDYGVETSVTIASSTATIKVFIPPIDPVKDTIYLYLRLAIPMDANIAFGSVTATIS